MKALLAILFTTILFAVFPGGAVGGEASAAAPVAAAASALSPAIHDLLQSVLEGLACLVAAAVVWLIKIAIARMGASLDAEREARIRTLAAEAALAVEETFARKVNAEGKIITGADKLAAAVRAVVERAPGVSQAEAAQAVLAMLKGADMGARTTGKLLGQFVEAMAKATPVAPAALPPAAFELPVCFGVGPIAAECRDGKCAYLVKCAPMIPSPAMPEPADRSSR